MISPMEATGRETIRAGRLIAAAGTTLLVLLSYAILQAPAGVQVFWPPVVALVIVFTTRRAAAGLFGAGLAGCILLARGHPGAALQHWLTGHAWPALFGKWTWQDSLAEFPVSINSWHLGALVFTLLLGAFAAILERGGGLLPLLTRPSTTTEAGQRRFLTSVFGLGLVCFFDGLANSLMVGRVARPVSDRLGISRSLLAYLVDTTSSAVACIAFISTWIAVQLTLIDDGTASLPVEDPAYLLFLRSIPQNYYCLFALVLAIFTIRRHWLVGPMRRAPLSEAPPPPDADGGPAQSTALYRAFVPLLVLVLAIPIFYYVLHRGEGVPPRFPISLAKIQAALGSSAGPPAFVAGSSLALLAAALFAPPRIRKRTPSIAFGGARQLLPALGILLLAWILGSVLQSLGTARQLAVLLGDRMPILLLPAATFLVGCLMSFVSGTSWGTMGLLMPLALPLIGPMVASQEVPPELLDTLVPGVIAAVFGGAVFGDHCSPFSDTTIVSSLACGITTPQHTITQLPYALIAAGTALGAGYLPGALGLPPWCGLLLGLAFLAVLTKLRRRRPEGETGVS